ncbi:cytochrome c [Paracoccus cavernae]|uniref:Cytochrome c n=1 Tax=Paracoccus cavernae TaxID=1571207 RepID=A0ABT8D2K7_9RHOB|nr:cytochrome c [Paracoccus cavernae]
MRQGAALYQSHCASCHGADLEGSPIGRSPTTTAFCPPRPMMRAGIHGITGMPCCAITSALADRPCWTIWGPTRARGCPLSGKP